MSAAVLAALERAVADLGWSVDASPTAPDGEHHWLLVPPDDSTVDHPVIVVVHDGAAVVVTYSIAQDVVAPEHRGAVTELLTRVNYGLVEGTFEFDLSDGEVRFRTSLRATTPGVVERAWADQFEFNLLVFDLYRPAVAAVAAGAMRPVEAVAAAESQI